MLHRLAKLLRAFSGDAAARPRLVFDENDHRLAAAALLVHAVNADGVRSPAELARLEALLKERFSLDEEEVGELIAAADRQNKEALDFTTFTAVVRRAYNPDGRRRILEMMWEIVFADGKLHEFEDNLVWRVGEMIGIDSEERAEIRRRTAAELNIALADGDA